MGKRKPKKAVSKKVPAKKKGALNPKQKRFVLEYVKDLNGAQAAIRAGYSKHTARSIASEHLTKPNIREAVAAECKKIGKSLRRDTEDILNDIISTKEVALATGNLHAATRLLELEGKHQAMFTDKRELSNPDGTMRPVVVLEIPDNGRDK